MPSPCVEVFFDEQTSTFSYVVFRPGSPWCAIIDSVLDYDPKSGTTSTVAADKIIAFVQEKQLSVQWILETHAHADHLSAAPYLKENLGGKIAIGEHIMHVQSVFKEVFNLGCGFVPDGAHFDHLFKDNEIFSIGDIQVRALHMPGHTPADMVYQVEGLGVFVADTLFQPDIGTARCDFPGGNAEKLYQSIHKILALDDDTELFMCHDYPPEGRKPQYSTTVKAQRLGNIHVRDGITQAEFVAMRTARDETLEMPTLILPAIQVNIRAGQFPEPEDNGVQYLKLPLNMFRARD
ncbi:MAG TPA: MBL fold metallo-hydrolase [Eoetvoesiella sp.]